MSLAKFNEVAEFDENGEITGLQFDSRERRIQEWREKKEAEEYDRLFEQLYQRNYARRVAATPEGKARLAKNQKRYRERRQERIRKQEQERRRRKYEADPVVNQCEECGKRWSPPYEKKRKHSKFCSKPCRNRYNGRRRKPRTRGIRDMTIRERVVAFLRVHPDSATAEIAGGIDADKRSLASCLCLWTKQGLLEKQGKGKCRYRLTTKGSS